MFSILTNHREVQLMFDDANQQDILVQFHEKSVKLYTFLEFSNIESNEKHPSFR